MTVYVTMRTWQRIREDAWVYGAFHPDPECHALRRRKVKVIEVDLADKPHHGHRVLIGSVKVGYLCLCCTQRGLADERMTAVRKVLGAQADPSPSS